MNKVVIALASLLALAACRVPPIDRTETVILPTIVVKDAARKPEAPVIRVPAIKPTPAHSEISPVKSTADVRCPPTEGETEQQRIIRKLDCLLERD